MNRSFWHLKLARAWEEKSVVWLTGVRRSGKTTLCREISQKNYFDCELVRVRRLLEDPEQFFQDAEGAQHLVLDEIHRLDNASEVLKIAADYFPKIKVLATGSSTLAASKKFKDSLTDRKRVVFLTPLASMEWKNFGREDLIHRMIRGGLPPFFLAEKFPESGYQDWIESFWAKDIEELFSIDKKNAFLKFFELLALQSGGLFEAKSFAAPCGVSHPTIASYLRVMEETHIAYVLRPFFKNPSKEIISAPKVYFFDTGFITYFNGYQELHAEERGHYWEHIVLNELLTFLNRSDIHYWRSKTGAEVDFVIKLRGKPPIAIECKWKSDAFDSRGLEKFRSIHPDGVNLLVAPDISAKRIRRGDPALLLTPLSKLKEVIEGI